MFRMGKVDFWAELWIRFRFQYADPNPDPGGKYCQIKTEKIQENW